MHGLKDIDLVYFDSEESEEDQAENQASVSEILSNLDIPVDVKNESLVHPWYAKNMVTRSLRIRRPKMVLRCGFRLSRSVYDPHVKISWSSLPTALKIYFRWGFDLTNCK